MAIIALAGNPNCGKTTLFNWLTGGNEHVGNWAGVTVEKKEGEMRWKTGQAHLVDLPGIYSLATYTLEECVSYHFLVDGKADVVINLIDGTSIERGLYLTMQLCELGHKIVVAVGMMDEVRTKGGSIDCDELSRMLGVPVVPIVTRTGENISCLIETALHGAKRAENLRYHTKIENAITEIVPIIVDVSTDRGRLRYDAIKILGGAASDSGMQFSNLQQRRIAQIRETLEARSDGLDSMTLVADARYRLIDEMVRRAVKPGRKGGEITARIDRIALHKYLAFPIFGLVMAVLFTTCFGSVGMEMKQWMEDTVAGISTQTARWLPLWGVSRSVTSLMVEGILGGVGSVLTFLPQIALVFLFLTLLEECGYLARAAFLMDYPLRRLGLTGKSFIPMLMGFGCTTPAVMAARTLGNERDRRMTILMTPYLSCSARFPVYVLFAGAFFPRQQGWIVVALYLLGILTASLVGIFLKKGPFRGGESPFLMEFPPYRLPSLRNVVRNTWERCADFLSKAGTLIFVLSVTIWLLQHFDARFQFTTDSAESLFFTLGGWIAPLFVPLGFGNREAAVALLAGLATKEAVVSTLGVVYGTAGSISALSNVLTGIFSPLSALSFLTFCALYTPCISALATMRRELGSMRVMLGAAAAQLMVAYGAALGVYQVGLLYLRFWG